MAKKDDMRKQLEAGLAVFLSEGKQITKVIPHGTRKPRKKKEEEYVEIEVDNLPPALRSKYFSEE